MVVIRYSIFVSLIGLLTACSGIEGLEYRFSGNPKLTKNLEISQDLTIKLPDSFPSEIPKYPQAIIQEITQEITQDNGEVRWKTDEHTEKIKNFYQQQLKSRKWEIIQPFSSDSQESSLIAQKDNLKIRLSLFPRKSITEFTIEYKQANTTKLNNSFSNQPSTFISKPTNFSDLNQVPEALRTYVQDLANLGILTAKENNQFNPNEPITRREYARWLVKAKNKFYQDSPEQQIRLGLKNAQPAFNDVPSNDADFPVIQGLAEAGLISSHLTGDSNTFLFRPDELLTRSDLIIWKVPLDMGKSLPKASIDGIKETWGFQDTTQIGPIGLRGLYADFQNGEQGNVRRVFGYTMLFQPQKTVTRAQAAAALWYFGYQGDGMSAEDVLKRTGNS
ncbi:S-layer homology domain-containing protein [cyanobacterium endosymbiont of Epithemia clementina EcSB]|uniref:S-layer homology domain-containing protein n=1 Tax=cyanobacterium endosymbiont of Epithemia clementina EcSB TaxID=3034674 RepID=UPI0024818433|nr:S-layer homology domain-containing protein [cyanobacterium endosymbiont of Epithemia clementina EcSB]WGT67899.1 S-layer homology domain-containing protein [cyanobacterium endosymbiont of Epithemia clementina EcSB]